MVSSFPLSCRAWSFCLEILAESIVVEGSLPLSATKSHDLLGGGGVWSQGLAGLMLAVVGTTGVHEREALETRQMGGRGVPPAGATHTS